MRKDTKKREEEIEDTEMKEKQGVRSKGRGEYVNTWQICRKTKIDKRRDKRQMKKMSKKGRERGHRQEKCERKRYYNGGNKKKQTKRKTRKETGCQMGGERREGQGKRDERR